MSYSAVVALYRVGFGFRLDKLFGRDKLVVALPVVGIESPHAQALYLIPQLYSGCRGAVSADKSDKPF